MGKRSNFERNARDFYPTPEEAVLPLLPHIEHVKRFAEPCAGDGQLVRILESHGHFCYFKSDIEAHSRDKNAEFLMLTSALACPWKLFNNWQQGTLERLGRINWISVGTEIDLKLFAARIAIEREIEYQQEKDGKHE